MSDSYGYVYLTTNLVTGKMYIGQRRGLFDETYFGSGLLIRRSLAKHGKQKFVASVLAFGNSKQELDTLERHFISTYRVLLGQDRLYNLATGGQGGDIGFALKGEQHPNWGKTLPLEVCAKISKSHQGKTLTQTHKQHIGESISGERNGFFGRHHLQKTRQQISQSRIGKNAGSNHPNWGKSSGMEGKHHTPEVRESIRQSHLARWQSIHSDDPNWHPKVKVGHSGIHNSMYGKHHKPDTIEKIRAKAIGRGIGRRDSVETCRRKSETKKLYWAHRRKIAEVLP